MTDTRAAVPPASLDDDDLCRELEHLHDTRHDTFCEGTEDALQTHTERMLALEGEYLRRFPERAAPHPLRTRAGRRRAAGQTVTLPSERTLAAVNRSED